MNSLSFTQFLCLYFKTTSQWALTAWTAIIWSRLLIATSELNSSTQLHDSKLIVSYVLGKFSGHKESRRLTSSAACCWWPEATFRKVKKSFQSQRMVSVGAYGVHVECFIAAAQLAEIERFLSHNRWLNALQSPVIEALKASNFKCSEARWIP